MSSKRYQCAFISLMASAAIAAAAPAQGQSAPAVNYNIPAQDLGKALTDLARQSNREIYFSSDLTRGKRAPAVKGSVSTDEALRQLLAGSGLTYKLAASGAITIERELGNGPNGAEKASSAGESAAAGVNDVGATPEILITGHRTSNVDIRRTENDSQPYVVFDAEDIRQSNATNLEDFFKTHLPMNTTQSTTGQTSNASGIGQSSIDLRGLGTNQTLILVDGRRLPSTNLGVFEGFGQPDINGIPLAAIERVEILPTTASGIYGGGATGGAINIIIRKDYTGADLSGTYGISSRGDAQHYRLDASVGFMLGSDRRTRVLLSGSHSTTRPLFVGDRNFSDRARALLLANNPNAFFGLRTPPFGYTSNIRSSNGSNLVLKNGTPLGSPVTFVPVGYAGPSSDDGAALVANAGKYNLNLPNDFVGARGTLVNDLRQNSLLANVRHSFTDRIEGFVDFAWLQNKGRAFFLSGVPSSVVLPASAPNNPFTTTIRVRFPSVGLKPSPGDGDRSETLRATAGLIVRLPRHWSAAADYTWSRSRTRSAFTRPVGDPDGEGPGAGVTAALANGTLDVLRDINAFPLDWSPYLFAGPNFITGPSDTILNDASFRVSGPLFQAPGGPVTLTGLIEHRSEIAKTFFTNSFDADFALTTIVATPRRSQAVMSYYLEGRVPLVSDVNAMPLVHALELQASVRRDEYTTKAPSPSSVEVPSRDAPLPDLDYSENKVQANKVTLSARYEPFLGLSVRGSYGTGFLPPSIAQIVQRISPGEVLDFFDPKRGGDAGIITTTPVDRIELGNPDLKPENSKSWSLGVIFAPKVIPGLRLSADYVNIKKTDEITALDFQTIINLEDVLPGRVIRAPLEPNPPPGFTAGVITAINESLINVAATRLEAYDFQADYLLKTSRFGEFRFYAIATLQPRIERRITADTTFINFVNFTGGTSGFGSGVLKWRGNGGITWTKGPLTVAWNAQYFGHYSPCTATASEVDCAAVVLNQGSTRIPSQMYHDLFVRYAFSDNHGSLLNGTELAFGVQNLFDKSPPIIARVTSNGGASNGFSYSTYGDPRLRRFTFSMRKHF